MADPQYQSIPPLKRPLLLLAVAVTVIALALGFAGTDERLLLVPAAVALVWAAAYRAQPEESVRQLGASQGVVVVRRTPPIGARQRREMPPTSSEFAPAAALAQARAKAPDAKLVRKYNVGMPDRPESTPEKGETRKKKRKGRGEGEGGKPTLGL
jgi:hypothetical protein